MGGDTAAQGNQATDDGGAIFALSAVVTIDNSTVRANTAADNGGAIFGQNGADVTIDSSTVSGNTAADDGGGVFLAASSTGSSSIVNSTFSGNSAGGRAGALNVEQPTVIRNSTFTGNRADSDGDGTGRQGGIFTTAGQLTVHNTIVAGNLRGTGTTPSDLDSNTSLVASSSNNLIGSAIGGSGGLTDGVNGNIVGIGGLGTIPTSTILNTTLANNGGPTFTHALVFGSPAVNAGNNANSLGSTDQRGSGFSRILQSTVDIGAFESAFETRSLTVSVNTEAVDPTDGAISLREAIEFANDITGGLAGTGDADNDGSPIDTITFDSDLTGQTITVANELVITSSVTIAGLGSDQLTISGGTGASDNHRVLRISDSNAANLFDVEINELTIRDGGSETANVFGAGISNEENLTLRNVTIEANDAGSSFGGGLAHFTGELNLIDSTIRGNFADSNGGGVNVSSGSTSIVNSTISGNTAGARGGGFNVSAGTSTIVNSTFSGNSADISVGGFRTLGSAIIRNSTFTGNRADADGNGSGTAPGLFANTNQLTLHNSIVAGNFVGSGTTPSDISNTALAAGSSNNIIGSAVIGDGGLVDGADGNIVGVNGAGTRDINTILDTNLADNGGPTMTHALVAGSLAIDAGDPAGNTSQFDQRGEGFDRIFGSSIDIGAFEAETQPILRGDVNGDGVVDFGDIPDFISVLQSGVFLDEADANGDGVVDFADIPAFIEILQMQ